MFKFSFKKGVQELFWQPSYSICFRLSEFLELLQYTSTVNFLNIRTQVEQDGISLE